MANKWIGNLICLGGAPAVLEWSGYLTIDFLVNYVIFFHYYKNNHGQYRVSSHAFDVTDDS